LNFYKLLILYPFISKGNILVKILYLVANIVTMTTLNGLLNGEFMGYGSAWISWTRLHNTLQYDYMGMRDHPKPGAYALNEKRKITKEDLS